MIKKIKKFVWELLRLVHLGGIVQLVLKSQLTENGWFKSYTTKKSINAQGDPIPWCTYSFIQFIEPRLKSNFQLFEYGCGNSTLWYSKRVESIIAVEHHQGWAETIAAIAPVNVQILFKEIENGSYAASPVATGKMFDIVIVDGQDRVNALLNAEKVLSNNGIIILDNAERPEYIYGTDYLIQSGFKRLDFWGNAPIVAYNSLTSIFYRTSNCLEI